MIFVHLLFGFYSVYLICITSMSKSYLLIMLILQNNLKSPTPLICHHYSFIDSNLLKINSSELSSKSCLDVGNSFFIQR